MSERCGLTKNKHNCGIYKRDGEKACEECDHANICNMCGVSALMKCGSCNSWICASCGDMCGDKK